MNNLPKLLIIGHMRHGKDTVAEFMNEIAEFKSISSSIAAAKIFIYDALKNKYNYNTFLECFEDRVNHRAEWYELICEYNKDDKSRLAKKILENNDIYVGMRDDDEVKSCIEQKVFDYVIGVYDPRKSLEPKDSFNIDIFMLSDIIICNNGTLNNLKAKTELLLNGILLNKSNCYDNRN